MTRPGRRDCAARCTLRGTGPADSFTTRLGAWQLATPLPSGSQCDPHARTHARTIVTRLLHTEKDVFRPGRRHSLPRPVSVYSTV